MTTYMIEADTQNGCMIVEFTEGAEVLSFPDFYERLSGDFDGTICTLPNYSELKQLHQEYGVSK